MVTFLKTYFFMTLVSFGSLVRCLLYRGFSWVKKSFLYIVSCRSSAPTLLSLTGKVLLDGPEVLFGSLLTRSTFLTESPSGVAGQGRRRLCGLTGHAKLQCLRQTLPSATPWPPRSGPYSESCRCSRKRKHCLVILLLSHSLSLSLQRNPLRHFERRKKN